MTDQTNPQIQDYISNPAMTASDSSNPDRKIPRHQIRTDLGPMTVRDCIMLAVGGASAYDVADMAKEADTLDLTLMSLDEIARISGPNAPMTQGQFALLHQLCTLTVATDRDGGAAERLKAKFTTADLPTFNEFDRQQLTARELFVAATLTVKMIEDIQREFNDHTDPEDLGAFNRTLEDFAAEGRAILAEVRQISPFADCGSTLAQLTEDQG